MQSLFLIHKVKIRLSYHGYSVPGGDHLQELPYRLPTTQQLSRRAEGIHLLFRIGSPLINATMQCSNFTRVLLLCKVPDTYKNTRWRRRCVFCVLPDWEPLACFVIQRLQNNIPVLPVLQGVSLILPFPSCDSMASLRFSRVLFYGETWDHPLPYPALVRPFLVWRDRIIALRDILVWYRMRSVRLHTGVLSIFAARVYLYREALLHVTHMTISLYFASKGSEIFFTWPGMWNVIYVKRQKWLVRYDTSSAFALVRLIIFCVMHVYKTRFYQIGYCICIASSR